MSKRSVPEALGVLWAKSAAGSSMHLLVGHLLDTAAVAEVMWDRFLASAVHDALDECSGGRGRSLFVAVCGLHDLGKASPAFQSKDASLGSAVQAAGLGWAGLTAKEARQWHHSLAGAVLLREALRAEGRRCLGEGWLWPIVAGHHGRVPGGDALRAGAKRAQGKAAGQEAWVPAQQAVHEHVLRQLDIDLSVLADSRAPTRSMQLAFSGFVIMADWIASDDRHFGGVDRIDAVSMAASRVRAAKAWRALGLRGGWASERLASAGVSDLIALRFGRVARPAQVDAVAVAEVLTEPGLLILEAPTGEGKTEGSLGAVEVLARKFRADGVFFGMPTQATCDPMFARIRSWRGKIDPDVPVSLLHGKRQFNAEWKELQQRVRLVGVDEFGVPDDYGSEQGWRGSGDLPSEWLLGRKRGLLAPLVVGTIDQLLHAATRTKHVMLRQAGLVGKVVVLDEVHAYDVYMAQFLFEALQWLGNARVPVVLLSATLSPQLREDLVQAYLRGATQRSDVEMHNLPAVTGYPSATSVCVVDGVPQFVTKSSRSWRGSLPVTVELLEETSEFGPQTVATRVAHEVGDGGCALVVCNTVARAQSVYLALKSMLGKDVRLLHSRLTSQVRADRTGEVLEHLGPASAETPRQEVKLRPRMVVVATQVAEQSFDVDVDVLFSDLAPIDLLLQRVGRLHRHERPADERPERLRSPRVIVSGLRLAENHPPTWPTGSAAVYGDHLLLRSAALVQEAVAGAGWLIPADVPSLVARGYDAIFDLPDAWIHAAQKAGDAWETQQRTRAENASLFLLSGERKLGLPTLEGLHDSPVADLSTDEKVAAVVRDGEESVEVVLIRRGPSGRFVTLGGRDLGIHGEGISDPQVLEEVIGSTVRLPARPELTKAAMETLVPLAGWRHDPWLGGARSLVLEAESLSVESRLSVVVGRHVLSYDDELGLSLEGSAGASKN